MGFETQPNAWQCGPYALKHALLTLGIVADAETLTRVSGATEDGADERDLGRAAARHGCALMVERTEDAAEAGAQLAAHMRARIPVLLCVDQWSHWITAAAVDDQTFVVLDSRTEGVFQTVPWAALRPRLAYQAGRGRTLYDLHPVVPARAVSSARFSLPRVEFLRQADQRDLARAWATYLSALLPVCRPPGQQTEWTVVVGDVLRTHAAAVLQGLPTRAAQQSHRHLSHAAFVADTHALEAAVDAGVALEAAARRIADLAA